MATKLKWMRGHNFGDALNPHLFEYISGQSPTHVKEQYTGECFLMIGSILRWLKGDNVCWGAGFACDTDDRNLNGEVLAVRGPLSRNVLLNNGVDCPEVYGDPAILLPNYYNPRVGKKYKLGVIPHIIDYDNVTTSGDILKIDLTKDYTIVIQQMLSCENIISSSLHGLIVSDAYQIPTAWVEFSDKVIGDGFKFYDYYESIGVDSPPRIDLKHNKHVNDLNLLKNVNNYDNIVLTDNLMKSCPFKK